MKITKTRLKEIIKEEVQKIVVSEVDVAQQSLTQARKDVVSGVSPEEKEEVSNLTNMIVAYSKKKNLTQGRVGKLIELLKQEMSKQMREGKRPPGMRKRTMKDLDDEAKTRETDFLKKKKDEKEEEDLDEMSAMSTGAVVTSPKKETLEENGWDEPVS